jgi:transcriptional regulator GlxA family with amidase domain
VARQTGFSNRDQMRRAFLRSFGQPPQVLRRNARNVDSQNRAGFEQSGAS